MSAKRQKNHVPGECCRCHKPTKRHARADYCWDCQGVVNRENDMRTAARQKAKRMAIKKKKEEELKQAGTAKRKPYFPPIRKEFSFSW